VVFDKNWLQSFIAKNDIEFLVLVIKPEDTEAAKCLVKYLQRCINEKKMLDHAVPCVSKLAEIGYDGLDEIVYYIFVKCGRNWSFSHFFFFF
jgi:hypothetical protein